MANTIVDSTVRNPTLVSWIEQMAGLTKPERIHWCDGSAAERQLLTEEAVRQGVLIPLNAEKLPGCYLHRSNPNDVARVEHLTYICTRTHDEAGPTNHWMAPDEAYAKLRQLFDGSMRGRTMYVVPYLMGPVGSPFSMVGVELTDSIYVVLNMGTMTRMGRAAIEHLGDSDDFNRGLHSVLDCNPDKRFICHFPQDNTIWSVGSGYGGNALLGKKCLALRIASSRARREGWLAEHMLILGAESPEGETTYIAAAFPSACGKTNFAMLIPPERFQGWKIHTVGDDIAWLRVGPDGRLWGINPEAGYFGVVPGTNWASNPNAMRMIGYDTIYTNVALAPNGDVWWEGKDEPPPPGLLDWRGEPWDPASGKPAAYPNSRFTVPMHNNPALDMRAEDPHGVPISAIVFGGRRSATVPLVIQSFNWTHGVFFGASMGSETTAAAVGKEGVVRRDPMAMLPFCGYNMGDYLRHWLDMQRRMTNPPRIFKVNWFRRDDSAKFLWPGFGENMRVLKWMIDRIHGRVGAQETLLGWVPHLTDLDLSGLNISFERVDEARTIRLDDWRGELRSLDAWFDQLGMHMPTALRLQRDLLLSSL
jgi:phosphoenolpyruvate carboxykinase (GTP)